MAVKRFVTWVMVTLFVVRRFSAVSDATKVANYELSPIEERD